MDRHLCEAGWPVYPEKGDPYVQKCGKSANHLYFNAFLCDECYPGVVRRNKERMDALRILREEAFRKRNGGL